MCGHVFQVVAPVNNFISGQRVKALESVKVSRSKSSNCLTRHGVSMRCFKLARMKKDSTAYEALQCTEDAHELIVLIRSDINATKLDEFEGAESLHMFVL